MRAEKREAREARWRAIQAGDVAPAPLTDAIQRANDRQTATTRLDRYGRLGAAVGQAKKRGRPALAPAVPDGEGGELLSLAEAGRRVGIGQELVRKRALSRGVPFVVAGGGKRVRAGDVERLPA